MSNNWILEVIEDSQRGLPVCASCSAPAIPAEHDGAIWLECSTLSEDRSRLRRLTSWGHTRKLLVAADQIAA
jgi:hypothetical protein